MITKLFMYTLIATSFYFTGKWCVYTNYSSLALKCAVLAGSSEENLHDFYGHINNTTNDHFRHAEAMLEYKWANCFRGRILNEGQ